LASPAAPHVAALRPIARPRQPSPEAPQRRPRQFTVVHHDPPRPPRRRPPPLAGGALASPFLLWPWAPARPLAHNDMMPASEVGWEAIFAIYRCLSARRCVCATTVRTANLEATPLPRLHRGDGTCLTRCRRHGRTGHPLGYADVQCPAPDPGQPRASADALGCHCGRGVGSSRGHRPDAQRGPRHGGLGSPRNETKARGRIARRQRRSRWFDCSAVTSPSCRTRMGRSLPCATAGRNPPRPCEAMSRAHSRIGWRRFAQPCGAWPHRFRPKAEPSGLPSLRTLPAGCAGRRLGMGREG